MMTRITSNMMRTVLDMIKDSDDISISEISPYVTSTDINNAIRDITNQIKTNRKTDLTIIISKR
jgi:hypothetical protein